MFRPTHDKRLAVLGAALIAWTFSGCTPSNNGGDSGGPNGGTHEQHNRYVGQTDFVSADGRNGQQSQDNTAGGRGAADGDAAAPAQGSGNSSNRTVEEGDIYQVMQDEHYVLNLNAYRGLQIIDFSDPSDPTVIGRVRVTGTPVEMYQVGQRVFVLMNNWRSYYGTRDDLLPTQYQGGLVMAVDVSDPHHPTVTGQAQVPGTIRTSRLTRGGGQEALFVVANDYTNGTNQTYVKSFSVSSHGRLQDKSELELGGYVSDIQATPQRLMVARNNYDGSNGYQTQISLVDISSPTGEMVEGDSVRVSGIVNNQFNMDIEGDVMRVVSSGSWNGSDTNHLETFDISDIHHITPIDHDTFGDGEQLYATLFQSDRAFFVTYRRRDPFHAFSIDADGHAQEQSEFTVSGWNDYFKSVASGTRLIGIGKNDQNANTMAVSLYDTTDLHNSHPLVARAEVDLDWSWSQAQWDHQAYSVLEKATHVYAANGELETGLVLLPFSGYDRNADHWVAGVQIFTFSKDTLTLRGTMDHGSSVRRSFVADRNANTTANLSDVELSLFDTSDPDTPQELGRVELAPSYRDFWVFGDYGVRRDGRQRYYGYYPSSANIQATDSLEVVSLDGDPDTAPTLTSIDIPSNASVFRHADQLVVVNQTPLSTAASTDPQRMQTDIDVWDLSTPSLPAHLGSLTTDQIEPDYFRSYGVGDCMDCGGYYYGGNDAKVVGDALVFDTPHNERELQGTTHYRYINAEAQYAGNNCWSADAPEQCTYYGGGISCSQLERLDGTMEPEVCQGSIQRCTRDADGQVSCEDVDPADIDTRQTTYDYDQYRYWNHYDLQSVDLSNPAQPSLSNTVSMPDTEDDVSTLVSGDSLYLTYRQTAQVVGDNRPYVRYYAKRVDFAQPSSPQVDAPVNIPGELIAVDGETILTRDFLWGEHIVETSIDKLLVHDGLAYLKGSQRFRDRQVEQVALDHAGHVLVSHRLAWRVADDQVHATGSSDQVDQTNHLTILDLGADDLTKLADLEVDSWASLRDARLGRALFAVPGGLLVINLDTPSAPYAQAYFPTRGWPRDIVVDGDDIYFAGGLYGLYKFGLNETNLASQ